MIKVAITGIIGSGKSEVANIVSDLGGFVLSADKINREMLMDESYLEVLKLHFPEAFVDGFDKGKLTSIVFGDDTKRELLNSIAHPEINRRMRKMAEGKQLVFCEIPLLSSKWAQEFDCVWLVKCDEDGRVKRICARDGRDEVEAKRIVDSQKSYRDIIYDNCNIIDNNGCLDDLYRQVRKLYCRLLEK